MSTNLNTLAKKWQQAQDALAAAKATEIELRNHVINTAYGEMARPAEGTSTFALGHGKELKVVHRRSYSINGDYSSAWQALVDKREDGVFVMDRMITNKPVLSVTEYKKLPPDEQALFADCVRTSHSQPSIKVEVAK